jgi:hypothetical protein
MSLVAVEIGSGVLVIESESSTLLDIPGTAFEEMVAEANGLHGEHGSGGMQRALLALETLFRRDSEIEDIEFVSESGASAKVDSSTLARIKTVLSKQAHQAGTQTLEITGRLLELDLARKSFRIHGALDDVATIVYSDILEPILMDALDCFVTASVVATPGGQRELISLEELEGVPETRFQERRSLEDIAEEQGVSALQDIESLAMPDADAVPLEEFQAFVKSLRRGRES